MAQLGTLIKEKRKRKGWSQTVLGDLIGMSTATIHRIEHGEKIPTDDELNLFADTLALDVDQLLESANLDRTTLKDKFVPATSYQSRWEFAHPADYSGRVWVQIYPQTKSEKPLGITIRWGAWQYQANHTISAKSLTLSHYKFNDGEGIPLIVELTEPCYVVFGKDKSPDKPVIDIINQWQRIKPMTIGQMIGFVTNFVTVYIGWFLGTHRHKEK